MFGFPSAHGSTGEVETRPQMLQRLAATALRIRVSRTAVLAVSSISFLMIGATYFLLTDASSKNDGQAGTANPALVPSDSSRDIICGPRCLQFLLGYYGIEKDADLNALVREVQWPDIKKGASLARLEDFLRRNGVHTLTVKPSSDAAITWPYPVLVHLRARSSTLGHYAICLPDSDRSAAYVWSGLAGVEMMPAWRLADMIDGGVIATSPEPIPSDAEAFRYSIDSIVRKTTIAIGAALLAAGVLSRINHALKRNVTRNVPARSQRSTPIQS